MSRQRLSDDIFIDLEQKILTGTYHVGDRLPSERELSAKYNTSRIPVRNALQMLVDKGYAQTFPGSGTIITSQGNPGLEFPSGFSASHTLVENKEFLLDSVRLRTQIEARAAALAAQNRDANDIKRIHAALTDSINEMRKFRLREKNSFLNADHEFHRSVILASKEEFLLSCFSTISYTITVHQYWSLHNLSEDELLIGQHAKIYDSILSENEAAAYQYMYEHLSSVEKALEKAEQGK